MLEYKKFFLVSSTSCDLFAWRKMNEPCFSKQPAVIITVSLLTPPQSLSDARAIKTKWDLDSLRLVSSLWIAQWASWKQTALNNFELTNSTFSFRLVKFPSRPCGGFREEFNQIHVHSFDKLALIQDLCVIWSIFMGKFMRKLFDTGNRCYGKFEVTRICLVVLKRTRGQQFEAEMLSS